MSRCALRPGALHLFATVLAVGMTATLSAQWLKQPTRGIPRTPEGKADLSAPVPRMPDGTPDLSGLWRMNPGSYVVNIAQDLGPSDIQAWAEARFRQHLEEFAKDPGCFLPSGPRYYIVGMPKIVQTSSLLVVLNEDLTYRQIFLDGRGLPKEPNPTFMGYSAGRWEGDTLVVESTGFTDRTLLDTGGHPHTEALQITERFHRTDFGHIDLQVTFEDPAVYAKPLVVSVRMQLVADDELIEFVCRENEKDYEHIVGKASDERHALPTEVLSKYVGAYELHLPSASDTTIINVTLEAGELIADRTPWLRGKNRQHLIPLSETVFAAYFGRRLRFVTDSQGVVTQLMFEAPEPEVRDVTTIRRRTSAPAP
jgi:hypothetical protein